MKTSILWRIGPIVAFFLIMTMGCGSEKQAAERRNFMIPKKSEMSRNSRYKEVEKRKTNKVSLNKSKRKKLF
jgi:hypothetical protein